jgi:mannose-6-phosphate isomerase-like protein (cupin superfamily)
LALYDPHAVERAMRRTSVGQVSREGGAMTDDVTYSATPVVVGREEGEAYWWIGALAVIKTKADETAGQLTLVDVTTPPGFEMPPHIHHRDDEGFWILEGDATFEIGGATFEAQSGDYLFGPRDIPHRFTSGGNGCRLLFVMVPGGLERLIKATGVPAPSRTVPPPAEPHTPEEIEHMKGLVAEYGDVELLL